MASARPVPLDPRLRQDELGPPGAQPIRRSDGTYKTSAVDPKKKKPPPPKTVPKYFVHSRRFLDGVVIFFAVCTLTLTRWLRPGFWTTIMYALVGLPIGLALSFLFYGRQKSKLKSRQLVCYRPYLPHPSPCRALTAIAPHTCCCAPVGFRCALRMQDVHFLLRDVCAPLQLPLATYMLAIACSPPL